ncbi:MAG: glycosyltransferase family 2 protein [Muribaculaceae bacterium]|nr:glycosyltransferase family 2 protein [Muribaculaceae bacterium]
MKDNKKVSVIISLYGYKYSNNLEAVIKSINEQTIDTEVIVSEQGENVSSVFKGIAKKMGAKYLLTKPEYRDGKMNFNIGKVRNAGASIATGEYLYFNDADVLMCNKKFLESILVEMQNRPQISMCRPLIYRLSMETSQMFIDDYLKNIDMVFKINNKDACLVEYCDGFLGAIKGGEVHELINGMPHVCTQYNYDNVINNKDFDYTQMEEFIWKPAFHYGGSMYSRDVFWRIGGYCELYYNWGLEDEDIHWKLKETTGLLYMYDTFSEEKLIHLEHERNYNNNTYEKNQKIFQERVKEGVKSAIIHDTQNIETFVYKFLNAMYTEIEKEFILGFEYYRR